MNRHKQLLIDEQALKEKPYKVIPGKDNIDAQKKLFEITDEIYEHTFTKSRQQMNKLGQMHRSNPAKPLNQDLEAVKQIFHDSVMYSCETEKE